MKPDAKQARQNAREEMRDDVNWLRENYGWQAKKREWATLAFGLMVAVAILVALAS